MPNRKRTKAGMPPIEAIERRILVLRGRRVMLDRDLAELYGVETRALNQAVKRNSDRFPEDFMFQLTAAEVRMVAGSRSQNVILKRGGNAKYRPYAFTEHGTVMLANVLKSSVAVRASIQVVRAFVNIRRMIAAHEDLSGRIQRLESRADQHDTDLQSVLAVVKKLVEPPQLPPKRRIGFLPPGKPGATLRARS
jgi:hypothetical protein